MIYLLILLVLAAVAFFLVRKFPPALITKPQDNVVCLLKDDPTAQAKYDSVKNPSHKVLSAKELLELSWRFLYELTEIVLNRFSLPQQQQLMECGRTMVQNGMKYQHIIEDDPELVESYTRQLEERKKASAPTQVQR